MISPEDIVIRTAFDHSRASCCVTASVTVQATGRVSVSSGDVDALVEVVSHELKKSVLRHVYDDVYTRLKSLRTDCKDLFESDLRGNQRRDCVMTLIDDMMDALGIT